MTETIILAAAESPGGLGATAVVAIVSVALTFVVTLVTAAVKTTISASRTQSATESLREGMSRVERAVEKQGERVDGLDGRMRVVESGLAIVQGEVRDLRQTQQSMHTDNVLAMREYLQTVITNRTDQQREGGVK